MADNRDAGAVRKRMHSQAYYVDGAAVRKNIPARDHGPEAAAQTDRKNAKVRYEKREAVLGLRYTIFLAVAIFVTIVSCFTYMRKNIQLTSVKSEISQLQDNLRTIQEKNDSLKESLDNTSTDLNELYRKATQDFGMVYPDEDQIIYYNSSGEDYIRQYGEIPENK